MTRRTCISALVISGLATLASAADKQPIDDGIITDQVGLRLANDQTVKGGALKVDVKSGVVTLSGQVETEKQKERATKLAKKVKGVKQVINEITLRTDNAKR